VKPDREQLRTWYRQAAARRAEELRALREGLARGSADARDAARAVGQALRGSGATFGFPDVSAVAALVESSADAHLGRRVEGLIEHLERLGQAGEAGPAVHAEWLMLAAGLDGAGGASHADIGSAWRRASERSGLKSAEVAERAGRLLGLSTADLAAPSRAALRLVPEALMRRDLVLPIGEDVETIRVASADPTSLLTELELMRLTGRQPVFVVAPPDTLERTLSALLDSAPAEPAPRRRVTALDVGEATTVLVVDDDGSSRLLARTVLEKRGYAVVEAGDGVEALDRLRQEASVALVVADLNMPEMDGLELLWEMRGDADLSHIPVIVLTGAKDEILETKLIEEGADDYVCKPLDPRLFLARVGATIRRADA
jgi:CheY-like chemotaxis protein